jgi:acyl transferase domain-containing protein
MEPIAIIGMACRLPGANSLEEFWNLLRDGKHSIDLIPTDRWDREATFDSDPGTPGKINTRHGGFIEDIDLFDNEFFHIAPEEARQMDPQQRILLELAQEAFEDAGLSPAELEGADAGVFVGVMSSDYHQTADGFRHIDRHTGSGSGYCMIANRISYQFNLRGPSIAIDSACSSSLVSTFMACESLWTNQCSLAVAAGVNLILSPALSMFYTRGGLSAPDGKCRTFSDDATGIGRGEGAGTVILKRLSDALRDRDSIYAVIRGGSVNHNGRGNGMSSPNRWAQQELLRRAYDHAQVAPGDVQYVELHGTGTLIGDAIEATALGSVLTQGRDPQQPCLVGSVKTNLGHLEGAAGVAGLIKLALCLNYGQLVPSLWFNGCNPHIALDDLSLRVQNRLHDWPERGGRRSGGISSFGLGGANAHLVLESAPPAAPVPATTRVMDGFILQLSARSEKALQPMAERYARRMKGLNYEQFSALCSATLTRPQNHDWRATFVAGDRDEMVRQLCTLDSSTSSPGVFRGRYRDLPKRKPIFVFPDFGALDFSAARAWSEIHPCFKETLAQCDASLKQIVANPMEPLFAEMDRASQTHGALVFVQFGIQVALAALWRTMGLQPELVAGFGMGQAAAWMTSGAIDLHGAISRIAASQQIPLTAKGTACLEQDGAFAVNCYSSGGKNIVPQLSDLLSARPNPDFFLAILELANQKEVDYIVQSLNVDHASLLSSHEMRDSVIHASEPREFWLALARLSVQHNIQWKNVLAQATRVRLPRYPWQHSRYWLDGTHAQEPTALDSRSSRLDQLTSGDRPSLNFVARGVMHNGDSESDRSATPSRPAIPALDRQDLLHLPESERRSVLAKYLRQQVAETLHMSADDLDEPHTLTGLGIDSLSALQLKNRVEGDLKIPVSVVKLLDGRSIGDLAADLLSGNLEQGSHTDSHRPPHPIQSPLDHERDLVSDNDFRAQLDAMSPEHIDHMLSQLLSTSLRQG